MDAWGTVTAGAVRGRPETETGPGRSARPERRSVMLEIKTLDKPDERRDFPEAIWKPFT